MYEQFDNILTTYTTKYFTYSVLNKGLIDFRNSNFNINYLINVSVQFSNPINRGSKSILL